MTTKKVTRVYDFEDAAVFKSKENDHIDLLIVPGTFIFGAHFKSGRQWS